MSTDPPPPYSNDDATRAGQTMLEGSQAIAARLRELTQEDMIELFKRTALDAASACVTIDNNFTELQMERPKLNSVYKKDVLPNVDTLHQVCLYLCLISAISYGLASVSEILRNSASEQRSRIRNCSVQRPWVLLEHLVPFCIMTDRPQSFK